MEPIQKKLEELSKLDDISNQLTTQTEEIKKQLIENKQEISELVKRTEKLETRTDHTEDKLQLVKDKQKDLEEAVIRLEMEKASYILRLQNFPEKKGEDLRQELGQALTEFLELETSSEVDKDIEAIYRVNSAYARRNKVPREVQIKFYRRDLKDNILKTASEKTLKVGESQIRILREIPWKVREKRFEYQTLVELLKQQNIQFRWLIPEGLFFIYKGKRYKINSLFKLEEFLEKNGKDLGFQEEEEEEENTTESEEEAQKQEVAASKLEERPKAKQKKRKERPRFPFLMVTRQNPRDKKDQTEETSNE
ncbi:PREDICTED: apolipoprotein A-IV-like [Gekko japonicus]|uniref:Apolipoprotein A-IV-like n=1 Tax=Gekko japonicus TaxID=146911 RepID=A0ABM1L422_GEKJA|nr:PREDICTED: apolipoprotein A-IV-like [Gekko japonicus]